jgi:hypothetical protein
MNHDKKPVDKETEDLIAQYLAKGGEITKGKTKAMPSELGISNNQWNNKLTKAEKDAKKSPLPESPISDDEQ